MWRHIQTINPVWYFDAAGLIIRPIKNQPATLLYSFVAHDPKKKLIVSIADFFTTSQTASNISCYVSKIRDVLEKHMLASSKFIMPPLVVIDHCTANLYAVTRAFNGCHVVDYLKWAFQVSNFFVLDFSLG
jgi:hypothetical protein